MTSLDAVVGQVEILAGAPGAGAFLDLIDPLSFWGGVDPEIGTVVDRSHPCFGASLRHLAVRLPWSRGSSSSSSTLLECARLGTAPRIVLLNRADAILTVGAAAAWELYGCGPTVAVIGWLDRPVPGTPIEVDGDGCVRVLSDAGRRPR